MSYQCLDCSFSGRQFPQGACPACGSLNCRRGDAATPAQPVARKPYRLAFAIALWVYLLVELSRRLSS